MRKSQRSQKTKKRRGGGLGDWVSGIFGSSEKTEATTPPASASTNTAPSTNSNPKHNEYNVGNDMRRQMTNGNTTQVVNPKKNETTTGGMAPINMKEPMFYPTQRQLEWATTAGLPCTKGGRSKRRVTRNKKSKRKSRR